MSALPERMAYTYANLLRWDDGVRYELYDGVPMAMSSPSDIHQQISGEIYLQLGNYLRGKQCRVYYAPFDVRLFERPSEKPENVAVVVQPDLMVVCDPNKVDRHGIHGAPDLVIEILSAHTALYDRVVKRNYYQQAGVPEYWIVDPEQRLVFVYTLADGEYHDADVYPVWASVPVGVLEDCVIDLSVVFPRR